MLTAFRRTVCSVLVVCVAGPGLPLQAQAGMLPTDAGLAVESDGAQRERIAAFVDRDDVRAKLAAYGVDAGEVKARVGAMTDEEAALVAAQMDALPAGGMGIVSAAVFVFLVLLITDILGFTKIFPFTRSIQK